MAMTRFAPPNTYSRPSKPSMFAGIEMREDLPEFLPLGKDRYRLTALTSEVSKRTGKAYTRALLENSKGETYAQLFFQTKPGLQDLLAFVVATGGMTRREYEQFDPGFALAEAIVEHTGHLVIEGRFVDIDVTQGPATQDGGFFRDLRCTPVPEDDQDQTPRLTDQQAP